MREEEILTNRNHHSKTIKIDKQTITKAAFDLLLEEGMKKISIRNVANRLHIKGASLYWHVKNKDELLELVAEEICKDIPFPDNSLSPEEQIKVISYEYRKTLLKIRDSAYVLVETAPTTPYRLQLINKMNEALQLFGLKNEDLFSSSWMLNNFITSFVLEEYRFNEIPKDAPETLEIIDNLPFGQSMPNMKREFQFGLDILLSGFKSKID